jgi:hypothetical protein
MRTCTHPCKRALLCSGASVVVANGAVHPSSPPPSPPGPRHCCHGPRRRYNRAGWLSSAPQASLEYYNPLVMSKLRLTRDAARWNPFHTDAFLWIDGAHNCNDPTGIEPTKMPCVSPRGPLLQLHCMLLPAALEPYSRSLTLSLSLSLAPTPQVHAQLLGQAVDHVL